jgi:hypothetical protein
MSFTGKVKNGVIVLPPGVKLPEGLEVQLTVAETASSEGTFVLRETAEAFSAVKDLPNDLAINLDYYVHGHSHKREPRRGRWLRTDKEVPKMTEHEAAEFTEKLCALATDVSNLPVDLAAHHDHYLHDLPKR